MRILHLLAPAPFGGLERVVQSLATEQVRAGHDIHVAAVLDPGVKDHPVLAALRERGVTVHALNAGARAYRKERELVRELCRGTEPDIVHTHGYRTDVLHGPVARSLGIATVSTAHGFTGGDWKNMVYETLQRRAFRRCAAAVAVSRPIHESLIADGIPPERVHWVPNAWADPIDFLPRDEARRVLGLADDDWYAGFIGRIGHEKGPDTFLDGVARFVRSSAMGDAKRVKAMLIGEGDMRESLIRRSVDLGVADTVAWPGGVANAGRLIRAFDVVVLSSRTEGTPMVLLEAMAAGVPVIATRVGGIPDVVSEGECLLIPPDDPDALAGALRSLYELDAALITQRTRRAADRLRTDFGAELWRERYDEVYRSCVRVSGMVPA